MRPLLTTRRDRGPEGFEIYEPLDVSRWSWLCPAISVVLVGALALLFGLSLWTALLISMLLACLIVTMWAYLTGQRPLPLPLGPVPVTRGDTRYFNWIAPWYDAQCSLFGLGRRFRRWTLALARTELRSGDRVLDVGCGNGVLTRPLALMVGPSGEAWGIDPAPDMIRVAMETASRTGNAAQFRLAAIEQLPFPDACFDVALISLVLHHLPSDVKVLGLKEVHRVLKPGGRLLVLEPDRPRQWPWRILVWPMRLYRNVKDHLDGRTAELLGSAGFVSVTARGRWGHMLTFWSARTPSRALMQRHADVPIPAETHT